MYTSCQHQPPCPSPHNPARAAAVVERAHPEQGWSLLCNGVVVFEDGGCLLPDGHVANPPAYASAAQRRHG